jgi:hypothetical protein
MAKIEALAARRHAGFILVLEDPYDEGEEAPESAVPVVSLFHSPISEKYHALYTIFSDLFCEIR